MDKRKEEEKKTAMETYDERLKGTFISVIFIGAFVTLSWFGVLYLYITTL